MRCAPALVAIGDVMTKTAFSGRDLRCLWLTREYPYPANAGDLIYSASLAESFAEAGARLTILDRKSTRLNSSH